MKIAIINDVHVGNPLMQGDRERSFSKEVMEMFPTFLQSLSERHQPDLFINMGDLIRSEAKDIDLERYSSLIESYKALRRPVVHLLGNHEIKQLTCDEVERVWRLHGFNQESYGYRTVGDVDIMWLGIGNDVEGLSLPDEQLKWLEESLKLSTRPLMIFTHCAIDDQDVNGNFFYEFYDGRRKDRLFLKNQQVVRELIHSRPNVIGVFQAHLHYFHSKILNRVPYITCPAMNDNICSPEVKGNNPEIYTLVTLQGKQLSVKAYSKDYCFAGYES